MMQNFFDKRKFSPLGEPAAIVLAALSMGRTGGICSCSIHAGPKGYSMKIGRDVVARGSTPDELLQNFRSAQDKAKSSLRKGADAQ